MAVQMHSTIIFLIQDTLKMLGIELTKPYWNYQRYSSYIDILDTLEFLSMKMVVIGNMAIVGEINLLTFLLFCFSSSFL